MAERVIAFPRKTSSDKTGLAGRWLKKEKPASHSTAAAVMTAHRYNIQQ